VSFIVWLGVTRVVVGGTILCFCFPNFPHRAQWLQGNDPFLVTFDSRSL